MNSNRRPRRFWRRFFGLVFWLLLVAVVAAGALCLYAFRDRSPGYSVRVDIDGKAAAANPRPLLVGFARHKITPELSGRAEPIWLAGFSQNRAATAVHDDLWAVACVIDDGYTRLGIVALDAIGFFHDDVVTVRERLGAHLAFDYTIVCSTHNHSTPDLMGLWGPHHFKSGVDPAYREQVISAAARALSEAAVSMTEAVLAIHEIPMKPEGLLTDTRKPEVYDPDLRVLHFLQVDGSTLGTIVGWANHPETPWGQNTEITADFPGYLRDALENGVRQDGAILDAGVGGVHLYVNGAIGGLMTTSPKVTVIDPYTKEEYKSPSHDKARALGRQLAARVLPLLKEPPSAVVDHAPIAIRARTFPVPVSNKLFLLAPALGVLDRGHPSLREWDKLRSEIALIAIGNASIACIPGEIYPELVNGGIECPVGADFRIEPLEVPPIRELMPGKTKFVIGLANDELGYIIPKSEWDQKPPYLYGAEKRVYGEINSVGSDAAATIHSALRELAETFK